jgi:deoxyribodipyrimidine photo-lyase
MLAGSFLQNKTLPQPLPAPKKQSKMIGEISEPPNIIGKQTCTAPLMIVGEKAAQQRLHKFVEYKITDYKNLRDFPSKDATSLLSPYFAAGMITVRQCINLVQNWQQTVNRLSFFELNEGPLTWVNELLWREFYRHILVGFPRVSKHKPFKLNTNKLPWGYDQKLLQQWQQGLTGVPIVDAGMRQLNQTGWMHNRLRMVAAMYLSKNLFLDWRLGEQYFMNNLIDGDLASNNGGWQWAASTGVDAVPYFRIFNPYRQSERFDPDGKFIRKYVPELTGLDNKAIHQAQSNKHINYPKPIVDLQASKQRAISAFKKLNS